jgi:hypothetical protein
VSVLFLNQNDWAFDAPIPFPGENPTHEIALREEIEGREGRKMSSKNKKGELGC